MECNRAPQQAKNTRAKKNELPNIVCKEDANETADAGDHSENENHNQIFNNRRVHNLPPNYFRNYIFLFIHINNIWLQTSKLRKKMRVLEIDLVLSIKLFI